MNLTTEAIAEAQELANKHGSLAVYWDYQAEDYKIYYSEEERPSGLRLLKHFRRKVEK